MENFSSERSYGRRGRGRHNRAFSGHNRTRGSGGGGERRNASARYDPVPPPESEIASAKCRIDFKIHLMWKGLLPLRWLLWVAFLFGLLINQSFTKETSQEVKINGQGFVYAKDGAIGEVSGDFVLSLNGESVDLENTIQLAGYTPINSMVEAQNQNERQEVQHGDVYPESFINTKVVHPWGFAYDLWNYFWSLETSKLIHYYDLWDEIEITLDELHKFISNLCYTFPQSSSSPSFYDDMRILELFKNLQNFMVFI